METIKEKPVVFILDDDKDHRQFAEAAFSAIGHKVATAAHFNTAVRAVHEKDYEFGIAYVDIHLQGRFTGLDFLRHIDQTLSDRMVSCGWSADSSLLIEGEALDAGVHHFFHKGVDSIDRVMLYASRSQVLKMLARAREDHLTGLLNFRAFRLEAEKELRTARDRGRSEVLSLLIIDVDHFKEVNETHGYLVGDDALQVVGKVLKEHVRPSDHLCRKSGDEFFILLPNTDEKTALEVGRKLQQAVRDAFAIKGDWLRTPVTISFGVGQMRRGEITDSVADSLNTLIWLADLGPWGIKSARALVRG